MSEAAAFFERFKNNLIGSLNTCAIGQIVRFDGVKMQADVKLLPDGELILDVPVGTIQTSDFYIRVPYKNGDYVVVIFAQRDIDEIMYGGNTTPSQRMLALDDAIVAFGINLFTNSLPSENSNDLVIGKKDGGASIVIKQNNEIEVKCSQFKVNGRVI